MLINDPETVAELHALYPNYEQALVSNDVDRLMAMFWASPYVARFGPTETLYGIDEIEAFRKGRSPANLARTIERLEIVTFGKDFASVTVAFARTVEGRVTAGGKARPGCGYRKAGALFLPTCRSLPSSSPSLSQRLAPDFVFLLCIRARL